MTKNKLAKNTLILGFSTLINKGLMFIMLPIFTRWLSTEEYGTYDLLATYVTLLIPIITVASSNAVFRLAIDKDFKEQKKYIANGLYFVLANLIISVLILWVINYFVHFQVFIPFVVMLVCEVLDNYFQGYLRAVKKLSILGICKTATSLANAIMIVVFVKFFDMGLPGLIYGYSCGFLLDILLIVFLTSYWKYISQVEFSIEKIRALISYSWALVPNDICWWIIGVSDRQIIFRFIGAAANGIYAIAYKVPNLCSAVFGVFNISWQEEATSSISRADRLQHYNNVLNKMVSLLLALCIGIISCNFIIFDYIFDSRFSSARLYSPLLISSVIYNVVALFYGGIQISLKRTKANGFSTIMGAAVNLIIHLSLVRVIGLYAAAISTVVSNMVVMYIRKIMLRNDYRFIILKRQYVYGLIFIYFSVVGMMRLPLWINLMNLVLAGVVFAFIVIDTIKRKPFFCDTESLKTD
ncbi:lipopolysaccharide biosynthesis protein [Butyrivibrio sp. INlla21]|uniref:lipopolysaccharide biosynthesis protein n=1 Tax=Butyrivibrio sp. INlla21 TaxID=1520811 RepID=UPI0008EA7793|nr:oligosaccharide flippase family protein [Butyrivibrio sp. INlla21]SFU99369.1 Membrane protein involved in the export of O-antigen and teichoic acid [Butyrivibrio sp. INlla21]